MRTSRTYYEILGLPRDSTLAQIKRRYRQLVRKYHPDVASTDQATATRLFIQIREAYEVLSDPSRRRSYDAGLDLERQRQSASGHRPSAPSAQPRPATHKTPASRVAQHIKDAQWAFIQRRFQEAADNCREALKIDGHNARVYAILGDIYKAQSKPNSAIKYYSYALQYDPLDAETEKKLTRLVGKKVAPQPRSFGGTRSGSERAKPGAATAMTMNMLWWGVAFFLIMLIGVHPGKPIPSLAYYIPQVSRWSWNLVGFMAGASAVVGMLLATNRLVGHPDDELVLENTGGNWAVIPTGIILLLGSGFFFIGAAGFYVVAGLAQGSLSRSVLTSFAAVAAVVMLSSMMYDPEARRQVLLFGGNVSFLSMLVGWYIGSVFKPLNEY